MKYRIKTGSGKQPFFAKSIYEPGWYGSYPYFKCSAPFEDGVGRQHLTLSINDAPGCDPSVVGDVIGMTHVPSGYVMIKKERYRELLASKSKSATDKGEDT